MKISYNWLKTLINVDISADEAAKLLTASGLEVEGVEHFESVKGGLKGVVIGQVITCEKHPDADKLKVTTVDIGTVEKLNIVCGAPNVAAGQKVIVATIGSVLYTSSGETLEIKKSKIRGVASEGMLCAEDEIGLGASHAGIMVLPEDTKIGLPAADYFKIENDTVLEIGLTPNRSDAASHFGVARDLAAILNSQQNGKNYEIYIPGLNELPSATGLNKVSIEIKNTDACKRYTGCVISGVEVKESPDWLKNKLLAIGLRPINNIVDITNFVLHETGQPLHAFDFEKITGNKVVVDLAKEGQKFKTLDGVERTLGASDLMICNEKEPMCIAGVFGGEESGVTGNTKVVFLESAYFEPSFIRKSSKKHGLKTDASFRFERGTDPEMTITAITRAANLIFELAGGRLSMEVTDVYPQKLEPYKVAFSYNYCNDLIGKNIDKLKVKNIIQALGIVIETEGTDGLLLQVPRYKTDVTRAADVVEEVMRIYGYNNVEVSKSISFTAFNEEKNYDRVLEEKIAKALVANGFSEIMCLSLSKDAYYDKKENLVYVVNPLSSDLNVMRADLLFGGLEAVAYNINRKQSNLKFYEIGKTYSKSDENGLKYNESKRISLFLSGKAFEENKYRLNDDVDFYFLKASVEHILKSIGKNDYTMEVSACPNLEYGIKYMDGKNVLVEFGSVTKKNLNAFDIKTKVYFADFSWDALLKATRKIKIQFTELPLYPSVRRDLAMLLDKSVKYDDLKKLAFNTERKLLKEVNLFDVYEGEKLGGKKSYALSFILQSEEATLNDKQIDKVMEKLISSYKEKFGAELR